ncbi:MAG: beta-ketoacyl-ACP synthase II [Syntrophobacterales bacterium]|nr:beta-ketoacyl-ACP synthase II [Syntrophobacterales bacterium]
MKRRVLITGLGAVSPVGNSARESWKSVCEGRSGVGPITKFDCSNHETRIAGEIKGFDPLVHVNKKELRRYDAFIVYALAAADMLMEDAAFLGGNKPGSERAGVVIGSAIGGLATLEKEKENVLRAGPRRISPFAIPAALANLAAGHVSIRYGLKGPINCPVTACAAGTYAIGDAFRLIAWGYADAMVAGGTEAAVCSLAIGGFNVMRALSTRNDDPAGASRPFDLGRDGFVLSEGCGLVMLEEYHHALQRGARIYAEVAGYGITSDAFHMAAPPPGHEGAVRCMNAALADAGMQPGDIDYINAHGTSTPLNDIYETDAIRAVFGTHAEQLLVSSTKSMTGHLLGAAGGIEAVFAAKAIEEGIVPPTINLENPDPGTTPLDLVPHTARKKEIRTVMSNTFGFGGANAVLIFKKFQE